MGRCGGSAPLRSGGGLLDKEAGPESYSGPAHSEMISELVTSLLEGLPSPLPGEEAVSAWRAMEAIYLSSRERKRVLVEKGNV